MPKLDLDNANVHEHELTVENARHFIDNDGVVDDEVTSWFDEAQGDVHSGKEKEIYLVIKITK